MVETDGVVRIRQGGFVRALLWLVERQRGGLGAWGGERQRWWWSPHAVLQGGHVDLLLRRPDGLPQHDAVSPLQARACEALIGGAQTQCTAWDSSSLRGFWGELPHCCPKTGRWCASRMLICPRLAIWCRIACHAHVHARLVLASRCKGSIG